MIYNKDYSIVSMLSKNWITETNLDHEYKRYVLLGYLKKVNQKFDQSLLYPHLADLAVHYRLLKELEEVKQGIQAQFPKAMSGLDWQKMEAKYSDLVEDTPTMGAIQEIIAYAIPLMFTCLEDGKTINDFYKEQLYIESIGIAPLYNDEGYLLLLNVGDNCTMAYRYNVTIFDNPDAHFKNVNTVFVGSYKSSISSTDVLIKRSLVRRNAELPNPATYAVKTDMPIPVNETLLPLAKQMLAEYLDQDHKEVN